MQLVIVFYAYGLHENRGKTLVKSISLDSSNIEGVDEI